MLAEQGVHQQNHAVDIAIAEGLLIAALKQMQHQIHHRRSTHAHNFVTEALLRSLKLPMVVTQLKLYEVMINQFDYFEEWETVSRETNRTLLNFSGIPANQCIASFTETNRDKDIEV